MGYKRSDQSMTFAEASLLRSMERKLCTTRTVFFSVVGIRCDKFAVLQAKITY